jgi:hypothetical protein
VSSNLGPEAIRDGMASAFDEGEALTTPWSAGCKARSQYDGEGTGRDDGMLGDCRVNKAWVRAGCGAESDWTNRLKQIDGSQTRPGWHWVKVRRVFWPSEVASYYSRRLFRAAILGASLGRPIPSRVSPVIPNGDSPRPPPVVSVPFQMVRRHECAAWADKVVRRSTTLKQ